MSDNTLTPFERADLKKFSLREASNLTPPDLVSSKLGSQGPKKKDVDSIIKDAEKIFNFLIKE